MINALLKIEIGIDPTIIDVAGIEVTWHGVFTALAVVVGVAIAAWLGRRMGYSEDMIYNAALALVIGGIIGARGLYVIENWSNFENDLGEIFSLNAGGISIYGALIGGAIGGLSYGYFAGYRGDQRHHGHGDRPLRRHHQRRALRAEHGAALGRHLHAREPPVRDAARRNAPGRGLRADRRPLHLHGARRHDEILVGLTTAQVIALAAVPIGLGGIVYLLRTAPPEERADRERERSLAYEESSTPDAPVASEPPAEEPSAE